MRCGCVLSASKQYPIRSPSGAYTVGQIFLLYLRHTPERRPPHCAPQKNVTVRRKKWQVSLQCDTFFWIVKMNAKQNNKRKNINGNWPTLTLRNKKQSAGKTNGQIVIILRDTHHSAISHAFYFCYSFHWCCSLCTNVFELGIGWNSTNDVSTRNGSMSKLK